MVLRAKIMLELSNFLAIALRARFLNTLGD
jgi:hypothetical protein